MDSAASTSDLTVNNAVGLIYFQFPEHFPSPGSENPQMHLLRSENSMIYLGQTDNRQKCMNKRKLLFLSHINKLYLMAIWHQDATTLELGFIWTQLYVACHFINKHFTRTVWELGSKQNGRLQLSLQYWFSLKTTALTKQTTTTTYGLETTTYCPSVFLPSWLFPLELGEASPSLRPRAESGSFSINTEGRSGDFTDLPSAWSLDDSPSSSFSSISSRL